MLKKYANYIVLVILGFILNVSIIVSSQESTTMDEQAHIPSAYTYVKYHDMRLNPEHPPLLKDLAGLPLLFPNVKFPTESKEWQTGINEQWTLGNMFIHQNNADTVTFWSRFPIILLALLLGFFIFKWTKEIAGTVAGLFALILYAFDPNVLGHNHYVTTDIGIAASLFIATYFFVKFIKNPGWKNAILAGIFLGVAQLTKFSAVLLYPFFGLIVIAYTIFKRKPGFDATRLPKYKIVRFFEYIAKYAIILVVCFTLIWVLYFYNTFSMPPEKIQDIANTVFPSNQAGNFAKSTVSLMSNSSLLKPLGEYFLGVFMVFARVEGGNTYYFFGTVSNHATPWYFPAVFVLKETIPFLFLLFFASGYAIYQTVKNIVSQSGNILKKIWLVAKNYLQTGVVQYSMLGFVLLYSYLSITGNLNIGFRHLFPILPFAYVLVSKKVFEFLQNISHEHTKLIFKKVLAIFVIWIILEPIIFFPSYISYFNEAAGGPKNGYKYVTDSNYDWGQDLKKLRNWVDDYNDCATKSKACKLYDVDFAAMSGIEPIKKIRIDYFGGSNPEYYFGDKFIPWHGNLTPESGWYAVSATFLQESIHKQKKPGDRSYEWLLNYTPVARAGDSIFVYYIP